jgi:hypothetical protein
MAAIPDQIVLKRHRDLDGIGHRVWVRRALLGLLTIFLLVGLANVFGQRPHGSVADSAEAKLELYAPSHLRGGLLYEARFTITAHRDIKNAVLQLAPGWNEGMQQNTLEPSPLGEASRNGQLLLTLGHIKAGTPYRLFLQFQVNPTNVAFGRDADVSLYDGGKKLAHIDRKVWVFP